jgi:phosphonopyruvate decarboxylase
MIAADSFLEHLRDLGYTQYVGVPCSFLTPFINRVIDHRCLDYVSATSEGEAIGVALGAYLAGSKTVVMCQNSGLGNMVNPLTSLNHPFQVPTLVIVTWRGEPGLDDEPQHEQMGRILHQLLDTLEIPWLPFPVEETEIAGVMAKAESSMAATGRPFALVMSKGSVSPSPELAPRAPVAHINAEPRSLVTGDVASRQSRTGALTTILDFLEGDEALIATTGKTGRELFTLADRPGHLYVVGGMGTASAIGLGIARALPHQQVVVLDGDGAALMKLGAMATVGWYQPENLLHVILDNEQHDSTGGQHTASSTVSFAKIASATNYRYALAVERRDDLITALKELRGASGPSLLHIKIRAGSPQELGRPTVKPYQVKDRFMDFLRANAEKQNPTGKFHHAPH